MIEAVHEPDPAGTAAAGAIAAPPEPPRPDPSRTRRVVDIAIRCVGGLVALLAGAGSALVEAMLTPLYIGSWPAPIGLLLAAVLGAPLVAYASSVMATRVGGIVPVLGWFVMFVVLGGRTTEGDVILPLDLTTIGLLCIGGASLMYGLVRLTPRNAPRVRRPAPPAP